MAKDTVSSNSIQLLDTTNPSVMQTAGQGAVSPFYEVDDYCAATAAGLGTAGSIYRMVRFPTSIKVKSFVFYTDKALDTSATASLQFDFNIAFSDSTIDGTPVNLQGLVPTTANTGATTTFTTYSSPNKMFGSAVTQPSANAIWAPTEYLLKGVGSTYPIGNITQQPLWQTLGFVDGGGRACNPGGNFDMVAYVVTIAGTAQAGNAGCRVMYQP